MRTKDVAGSTETRRSVKYFSPKRTPSHSDHIDTVMLHPAYVVDAFGLDVFPGSFTTPGPGSIRNLVSFLRSAPSLEEMKLDFLKTERFDAYTSRKPPGKQLMFSMPLVGKVMLSLRAHGGLQSLLRALYFPFNDLSIAVHDKAINDWDDEDGYGGSPEPEIDNIRLGLRLVNAMFPRCKKYPKLTTLTLRLLFWDEAILRSNVTLDKDILMNYAMPYSA